MPKNNPKPTHEPQNPSQDEGIQAKPREVKRLRRVLWWVGATVCMLIVGMNLWVYFYLNPYLKYKICESVAINSDSVYQLDIGKLKIRFLQASIQAENVRMYRNEEKWKKIIAQKRDKSHINLSLQVKTLRARKVKWLKFLVNGSLEIGQISLKNPEIRLENYRSPNDDMLKRPIARRLQDFFGGFSEKIKVGQLLMSNSKIYFKLNTAIGLIFHQGESIDFDMRGFELINDPQLKAEECLKWEKFNLDIKKYTSLTPDKNYQIKAYQVHMVTEDSTLDVKNIRVLPNIERLETYQNLNPRIRFKAKHIHAKGLDYHRLLFKSEFDLYALKLQTARLETEYTQESESTQSKKNRKPGLFEKIARLKTQLRNLPIYIRMDSLKVDDFSFQFWEKKNILDPKPIGYHQAEDVDLDFCKLALGRALDKLQISRPLYSENVNFLMRNYSYQTPDGFYKTYIQKTRISSSDSLAYLDGIHFEPMISPEEFSARTYYQQMQIDAQIKGIHANGLDVDKLVYQQQFVMDGIHLQKPVFKAYLDKQKPLRPGQPYQNFEQVLQSIPLYVDVDTFDIQGASIDYREKASIEEDSDNPLKTKIGWASHQAKNISLQVLHISLGKALNGSALSEIDTKSLKLSLNDYYYQNHTKSYEVFLQSLDVSSAASYIRINALQLLPNGDAKTFSARQTHQVPWLNISISQLEGRKIDFKKLLMYQEIDWGYLSLYRPEVNIYQDVRLPKKEKKARQLAQKESSKQVFATLEYQIEDVLFRMASLAAKYIPHRPILTHQAPQKTKEPKQKETAQKVDLRKILQHLPLYLKIDTLEVKNGFLDIQKQQYSQSGKGLEQHRIQEIDFIIPKIKLGQASLDSSFSHFYSGNILLTLKKYHYIDPNEQFYLTLDEVQSSLRDSVLNIKNIVYQPLTPKRRDSSHQAKSPNHVQAHLKGITASAIDLDRLVFEQEFVVRSLALSQPIIKIYADRRSINESDTQSKTLEDILADIPIYMRMDTFSIHQAQLEYEAEVNLDQTGRSGISKHQLQQIDFSIQKVEIASKKTTRALRPENKLFYSQDLALDIQKYSYFSPGKAYRFDIQRIQALSKDSSLRIQEASLKPLQSIQLFDSLSTTEDTQYDISVQRAIAKIADPAPMFDFKNFPLKNLEISGVDIQMYQNNALPAPTQPSEKHLAKLISEIPFALSIQALSIYDTHFLLRQKYFNEKEGEYQWNTHQTDSAYLQAQGFVLDSNARAKKNNFLFSESFTFGLKDYHTFTPDKIYRLDIGELEVKSPDSTLCIKNLQFKPTINDKAFTRLKIFQADRFMVEAKQVDFSQLHLNQLLNQGCLFTERLHIKDIEANVFRDKRVDRVKDFKPMMPQEVFQMIHFDLRLDTISVENGKITYGERVPKGRSTGEVFFSNINGQIFSISNLAGQTDTMRMVANCQLMGAGLLTARLKMPLYTRHLYCTYHGSLGEMKAAFFNRIIETNEYIKIRKGLIEGVEYAATVRDSTAQGTLKAGYKKLKIKVLKEDNPEKKRKLLTFLANLIIKSRNNLQSRRARIGKIEYTRPKDVSFISMLWRSLATGLVDTLK